MKRMTDMTHAAVDVWQDAYNRELGRKMQYVSFAGSVRGLITAHELGLLQSVDDLILRLKAKYDELHDNLDNLDNLDKPETK